jgi:HEAT repeat protein
VKPADVTDKKVRARIAQGFRQVAFETGAHTAEAVDGLVLWGGKFSAPLLIELLEKQTGAEEPIYKGLGKLATPEAVDAVVKRLGTSGTGSEAAFACLKTMGPVAEEPLVAALPFESPESNIAAIGVLGEIGTKKSNSILRQATKSENPEVSDAAKDALRSIQERQKKAKPAA